VVNAVSCFPIWQLTSSSSSSSSANRVNLNHHLIQSVNFVVLCFDCRLGDFGIVLSDRGSAHWHAGVSQVKATLLFSPVVVAISISHLL
jgi:hypothetical protein